MSRPVFVSYARKASRKHAEALHNALGKGMVFLDSDVIEIGDRIPEGVVDALFGARVVVIFAEPVYFTRWYCLLEFRIARTPFLRTLERPGATTNEKEDALRSLVLAMPPEGVDPMLERFPPLVRGRNWPGVGDVDDIAELVLAQLATNPPTFRERYEELGTAAAARTLLLESARLPSPMRIGSVPFVPQVGLPTTIGDAFVGRADDLWRIHDLLWTERGDPATSAGLTGSIEAVGGFGKTRLALEYLYRYGPKYFRGGLFWINAESEPESQLYAVLQALNESAPAIEAIRQIPGGVPGAVARAIRSRPNDAPTPLFIIDNIPDPAADQPPKPLDTWCPVLSEVPVLTTSRTRVALGGGGVVALPIETLDPASAVDLLTTQAVRGALSEAEWREIADWVGYLPLALELLNRVLRSGEKSARGLLHLSRERGPSRALDAVKQSIRHVVPEGSLRGVTEAFSASFALLSPEERNAAHLIAWMAPAPIPTFVIGAFGPKLFPAGVRGRLLSRSFVTEVRDRAGNFYGSMHRVLADFVRASSDVRGMEARTVAAVLKAMMEFAEGRGAFGSSLVRICAPLAFSVFHNWIDRATINEFLEASDFANETGAALKTWGYPALARDLFASLAAVSTRRLGNEHPNTLSALSGLGLVEEDFVEAQKLLGHVLDVRRRTLGDEHLDTLLAMHNLAVVLNELGDYVGAQELQNQVLEAYQRILGESHQTTLDAMHNLAYTRAALNDNEGARELQEIVFKARCRLLGEEDRDTLTAMANLAGTLSELGENAKAQELLEKVVEVMERILGAEHPDTSVAKLSLASVLHYQKDHEGARRLQESVVEVIERILGQEHPITLDAWFNLSNSLGALGDDAGGQEIKERVVATMRRILGDEHPRSLFAMSVLGNTRRARNDGEGARELHEFVLEVRRRILGDQHPDTLVAMENLASTRRHQQDYAGAQELQERALEAKRDTLGDEHPDTLDAMHALALTRSDLGDYAGAQELQERVLEARRRILGEDHSDTLWAMNNLASTWKDRGDYASAQELQELVLEIRRRLLGDEHRDTLVAMLNLAATLGTLGDHTGARKLEELVLEAIRRIHGEKHPDTLHAMDLLASTLHFQKDYARARELRERVLEMRRLVLGDEHLDTVSAMNNLAATQFAQGEIEEAQELQERVLSARQRILGEEHPATSLARYNLGLSRRERRQFAEARKLQQRALKALERELGLQHPETVHVAWGLHKTLVASDEPDAAGRLTYKYLYWLVDRDPASLTEPLQKIQIEVRQIIEARSEPPLNV